MACWNEPTPLKTILVANSGIYVQTSLFFLFIFLFLAKKKKKQHQQLLLAIGYNLGQARYYFKGVDSVEHPLK